MSWQARRLHVPLQLASVGLIDSLLVSLAGTGQIEHVKGRHKVVEKRCERIGAHPAGILFSSCAQTSYLSMDVHRGASSTKHPKSVWAIDRPDECHTFCTAEAGGWTDQLGHYWNVAREGESDFGTRGERLAFFSSPSNVNDPWHGFPVGGRRGMKFRSPPPDDLVEKWYKESRITYVTYTRIITRRV